MATSGRSGVGRIAYKIENNIYELKLMTGFIDKKPDFWAMIISKDVLIVITLGFISYLIWSFLLEVSLKEWEKRNPKKMAVIKIREIKRVIGRLNRQLGELKSELVKLDNELSLLEDRVKNLKTKLSHIFFDKNEASRRLTDFFSGWLHYINLNSAYSSHRSDYEQEFEKYRSELINQ
jgi:regulator of replication initiation timing